MAQRHRLGRAEVWVAVLDCTVLTVASLIAYVLVTQVRPHIYPVSRADDLIGGLWAMIATIFVCRDSYQQSITAAVSRVSATFVSFALCLIYLIFLPSSGLAVALLIGLSALAVTLLGRPEDAITAAITSAVVMVVAVVSPAHAWQEPILRFADTIVGALVGVATAWAGLRVIRPRLLHTPDRAAPPR
jgi:uncharacterized membrane protein YccC